MKKPPAFQFYPDDFLGGTGDMTQSEVGAYILLLCHQWNKGGIDKEFSRLELMARGAVSEHVLSKFKTGSDGKMRQHRLELERKKQHEYRKKQAVNGSKGGRPRTEPKPIPSLLSGLSQSEAKKSSPSPSPSPNRDTDIPAGAGEHGKFIFDWCQSYKEKFGVEYKVMGGRDGAAAKELLRLGVSREDLIGTAKKAWVINSFICNQARTIHGLKNNFNQIQVETKNGASILKPKLKPDHEEGF